MVRLSQMTRAMTITITYRDNGQPDRKRICYVVGAEERVTDGVVVGRGVEKLPTFVHVGDL